MKGSQQRRSYLTPVLSPYSQNNEGGLIESTHYCKMISKLWLLVILLIGLIKAKEEEKKQPIDPVTEERLKERWTAFVAEVNKELDFDTNASSQG